MIEHYHGAYTDAGVGESAYPHRGKSLNVLFVANWQAPVCAHDRHVNESWARSAVVNLPNKIETKPYVNYAVEEDIAYSGDFAMRDKLSKVRRILDPYGLLQGC